MKALKVITSISLILAMLAVPVLASEFVPSAERPKNYEVIGLSTENDDGNRTLVVVPMHLRNDDAIIDADHHDLNDEAAKAIEEQIKQSLNNAVADLEDNLIHNLVPEFNEVWDRITGGAPLENHVIFDIFEVACINSDEQAMIKNEKITFTIKVDGIGPDDKFVVLHKPTGSDEWVIEDHTIDAEGNITIYADSLSPFAIIKDSGKAPEATVTSPQTGVSDYTAAAILVSGILAGLGIVCVKKSRRISAQ